jgi:hypothetical protein
MKLYHGSYTKIVEVDLSKCERYKDFGQGFYVTKFRRHAEDWALKMGEKYHTEGFVTEFDFYESTFDNAKYSVLRFDGYSEEWLDFVVMNRDSSEKEKRHNFDIVEGPVADDKIQRRLIRFLQGKILRDQFLRELIHHEPTHQICFCTVKSLQTLRRIDDTPIPETEDIGELLLEALMIDRGIDEVLAADLFYTSETFEKLADASTKFYEKTWYEIYEVLKNELAQNKK